MLRLFLIAITYALLNACASTAPAPAPDAATANTAAAIESKERPFPDDSVYPLLVAEFALRRRAYDVALDNYLSQSRVLRDARISAHTTRLTQFMQREQEALEASLLWVELAPDDVEANSTVAALLVRQGRTVQALPHMAIVERGGTPANFPTLLTGFEQLNARQRTELVSGINKLAIEFPENTPLMLTQALIHTEFDQYEQALDKLDDIYDLKPYQPQAVLLETKILLTQGAKKPFTRLQKALQKDPEDQRLRLQYARLLTTSDMTAAREQFEILSAQAPRDGDLLLSLALINREVGDDLAAKAYLQQLLALEQRVDEAHYYLGRIAEEDGDTREAVSQYMQVEDSREFLSASSRVGHILIAAAELERNHRWFDRQRQANPLRREQLYALEAELLTQAGAQNAAMQVLNQALTESPESTSLLYARSMLSEQQDDLALMERDLRTIIANEPDNTTALNALGYSLANRTERYTEALALISEALALEPDEPAILDSMGWVLYRTGRYDEALDYLTRAYAVFPDPEVAAHLGEVLWVTGDTDGATAIWREALAKAPDHTILLGTLKRLGVDSLNGDPLSDGDQVSDTALDTQP
ncbi:MAG: tetratricopeptide repeat protein [Halioglobus sp.]